MLTDTQKDTIATALAVIRTSRTNGNVDLAMALEMYLGPLHPSGFMEAHHLTVEIELLTAVLADLDIDVSGARVAFRNAFSLGWDLSNPFFASTAATPTKK